MSGTRIGVWSSEEGAWKVWPTAQCHRQRQWIARSTFAGVFIWSGASHGDHDHRGGEAIGRAANSRDRRYSSGSLPRVADRGQDNLQRNMRGPRRQADIARKWPPTVGRLLRATARVGAIPDTGAADCWAQGRRRATGDGHGPAVCTTQSFVGTVGRCAAGRKSFVFALFLYLM